MFSKSTKIKMADKMDIIETDSAPSLPFDVSFTDIVYPLVNGDRSSIEFLPQTSNNSPDTNSAQDLIVFEDENRDEKKSENQYLAEQDDDGDTLLHTAILCLITQLATNLIGKMTAEQMNISNLMHQTPIHLAALTGQGEIIRKLLDHGADIMKQDKQGRTALHIMCEKRDTRSLQIVFNYFKEIETNRERNYVKEVTLGKRNNDGHTCFHVACQTNNKGTVQFLIDMGVNMNLGESKAGKTGLHLACEAGLLTVVKLLVNQSGINLDEQSYDGQTALIAAYHKRQNNIVGILRNAGALFSKREILRFGPFRD